MIKLKKKNYPCYIKAREEIKKQYGKKELYKMLGSYWKEFFSLKNENVDFVYFGYLMNSDYELLITELFSDCKNCYLYDDIPNLKSSDEVLIDGHPNKKGHLKIAELIFNYLVEIEKINKD